MRALKEFVRRGLAEVCLRTGLFKQRLRGKVAILAYHRVLSEPDLDRYYVQPGMYVRADAFEAQMQFVKENFEVVPLARLLELWQSGGLDPRVRYCVITFDDGWRDNYLHAYPVLRRLGLPATVFLPTRFVGTDEWFWPDKLAHVMTSQPAQESDRGAVRARPRAEIEAEIGRWKRMCRADIERALDRLLRDSNVRLPTERAVMNWDEVGEMAQNGISFGSHSVTHAILTRERTEDVEQEIRGSLRDLQVRRVNSVPVFCYPNGNYSAEIAARVRSAGYAGAVSSRPGWETRVPSDLFGLRRVGIHQDVTRTLPLFALRLSGLDDTLRRQ